jgi:hypothetical protein
MPCSSSCTGNGTFAIVTTKTTVVAGEKIVVTISNPNSRTIQGILLVAANEANQRKGSFDVSAGYHVMVRYYATYTL